jgi:spore coat protein A
MFRLIMRRTISFLVTTAVFVGASDVYGEPLPGGTLDPTLIPKYVEPLTIPPAMPRMPRNTQMGVPIDYEIAARQIVQQILPVCGGCSFPPTTVWAYGPANDLSRFNYPAFTIEAKVGQPVRVKWINDLVAHPSTREFLPHLFAVDQTLHWANPPGGIEGRDMTGMDPSSYMGPVPLVTHLHGGHTGAESDGYPEAWYLPNASDIPAGYATQGTHFDQIRAPHVPLEPGAAVFQYPNDQEAATLWYHDHALGITRVNVYAGLAGFYLLRGGKGDLPPGVLPGPAPAEGDPIGKKYYEIPIAIQDKSFNADGSLFYPDSRAFFDGYEGPYIPDEVEPGVQSDISPIWNPEAFFNTMV